MSFIHPGEKVELRLHSFDQVIVDSIDGSQRSSDPYFRLVFYRGIPNVTRKTGDVIQSPP